jgi:hypothetical protein
LKTIDPFGIETLTLGYPLNENRKFYFLYYFSSNNFLFGVADPKLFFCMDKMTIKTRKLKQIKLVLEFVAVIKLSK